MPAQLKNVLKGVRAGRYPFYYVLVLLPDAVSLRDVDLIAQSMRKASSKNKGKSAIVEFEDRHLTVSTRNDIALTLKFKYDWRAKAGDYSHFYSKIKGTKKKDSAFLTNVQEIQQMLFKEASGLELQIYRHGLILQKVRVPSGIKRQPGYREALSFAGLAPIWTLILDPLSKAVRKQSETEEVSFPRIVMKDRDLFPWGDGFDFKESLTNALSDYLNVASSIEARAIADKSFDKISQAKSMCIIFERKAREFAAQQKLGSLPVFSELSHKILELDYQGMIALQTTLSSIESKIDKVIDELQSRR